MTEFSHLLGGLLQEEAELQFDRFDNDVAWRLGCRLVEVARAEQLPIAIDIARNGQRLFHCAMPGASVDNAVWIERKKRVVDRVGHSSWYVGNLHRSRGTTYEEKSRVDPYEFAASGGCFPVIVRGTGPVGTVTVSGLPQADDHALIVRVLRDFLAQLA